MMSFRCSVHPNSKHNLENTRGVVFPYSAWAPYCPSAFHFEDCLVPSCTLSCPRISASIMLFLMAALSETGVNVRLIQSYVPDGEMDPSKQTNRGISPRGLFPFIN